MFSFTGASHFGGYPLFDPQPSVLKQVEDDGSCRGARMPIGVRGHSSFAGSLDDNLVPPLPTCC